MGHLDTGKGAERRIDWLAGPAPVVLALVLCAACHGPSAGAAPAPPSAPTGPAGPAGAQPPPPRQILSTLPAHPLTFELSLEDCAVPVREKPNDETACTFAVRLLEGAKVLDRIALPQTGCGPATSTTIDRTLGADRDAKAFSTSDEHCEIDVAVRTVALAPHVTALLLTQQQGFEYRYRRHALLVPRQGKLETLWSYDEDSLATDWTTTTVIPALPRSAPEGATQDVAFIATRRTPEGLASKVEATRLHLDPSSGVVQSQPLPDAGAPLFVLAAGAFKNTAATKAARQHCVHDLEVMRASLFPKLRAPASFFGAVFANRKDADDNLALLATCAKPQKGTILESVVGGKSNGGHQ
jgi:hypothetical protein